MALVRGMGRSILGVCMSVGDRIENWLWKLNSNLKIFEILNSNLKIQIVLDSNLKVLKKLNCNLKNSNDFGF
jgi:hypothetical protein